MIGDGKAEMSEKCKGMRAGATLITLDVAWAVKFPVGGKDRVTSDIEEGIFGEISGAAAVVVLIDEIRLG